MCPNCGSEDVIERLHVAGHPEDCPQAHALCTACDYGLCCGEC